MTVYYIYNIGVLTVNIEFMWQGLETGERRALPEKNSGKNLSSQYNLTAQIERVQDKMFYLSNNVICL